MHCPTCGQQQVSDGTSFCSKCGFRLTEVAHLLSSTTESNKKRKKRSKLKRGFMQSFFLFFSVSIVFVIGQLLYAFIGTGERYAIILSLILLVCGVFRLLFAIVFESSLLGSDEIKETISTKELKSTQNQLALGDAEFIEADSFVPLTVITNDLATPSSVTDSTTRLLQKEK